MFFYLSLAYIICSLRTFREEMMDRVEPTFGKSKASIGTAQLRMDDHGSAHPTAAPKESAETVSTSQPTTVGFPEKSSSTETVTAVALMKGLVLSVTIVAVVLSVFAFFFFSPTSSSPSNHSSESPGVQRAKAEMERRRIEMRPYVVTGVSASLCEAYENVVYKAIELRRSGVPMDTAMKMADPAMRQNRTLWEIVSTSIQESYRDPDGYTLSLRIGWWTYSCTAVMNGYRY